MTTPALETKKSLSLSAAGLESLARNLARLSLGLAGLFLLVFALLAALRSTYPYELEWIEGAMLDEMRWIIQGRPLYAPPDLHFIPFAYNPLYFYLSAALMKLIGIGFFAPRLISILSTLGCFLLLYLIVFQDTRRRAAGFLAAGLYAACYRFAGAWMDLAKTDSLFLFLILLGFFFVRDTRSLWRLPAAAALFLLAYYTKQSALPVILGVAAGSLVQTRGRTWPLWLAVAVLGIAIFWGLDWVSDGWYSFYTVNLFSYHEKVKSIWGFWAGFLPRLWPALLLSTLYPLLAFRFRQEGAPHFWLNLGFGGALLLSSWSVFLKVWTYANGYLPACLGLALLSGLALGRVLALADPGERPRYNWIKTAALSLCLLQFLFLAYLPWQQLPTAADRESAKAFVRKVAKLPGEVLVFSHGHYNYLASNTTYLNSVALGDILGTVLPPRDEQDRQRIAHGKALLEKAKSEQVFDWVFVDSAAEAWLPYYIHVENIFTELYVMVPVTGSPARPESLLAKNPVIKGGAFPLSDPAFERLFLEGWDKARDWGRRATGERAAIQVVLAEGQPYQVQVEGQPACEGERPAVRSVRAVWDGQALATFPIASCAVQAWVFEIPGEAVRRGPQPLAFEFEWDPVYELSLAAGDEAASFRFQAILFSPQ
jgi:4-amino-4-deoxy-L-arabinose transferase-like glycosyltransferase